MQMFTPIQYLKIDIAGNHSMGKAKWDDRIEFFYKNEANLDDLIKTAKDPALFYAGVQAYRKAMKGEPTGYPISLDATASGAQIMAVLIGCEKSARLCNVIDTGDREDFYKNVYTEMCKRVPDVTNFATAEETKKAIMTALYGSLAVPKRVFGEGAMLQAFKDTMNAAAPGVWALNSAMLDLWQADTLSHDWSMPDNFHVRNKVMADRKETVLFLDDAYEVYTKVNAPVETGKSIGANICHSIDGMIVREMGRRCTYEPAQLRKATRICLEASITTHTATAYTTLTDNVKMVKMLTERFKESGFLSARIVDHIDQDSIHYAPLEPLLKLLESMPAIPFPVLMIHDCFRVLPNYGNALRKQYNQILYEIANSTMLEYLASQITGSQVTAERFDHFADQILQADYALS